MNLTIQEQFDVKIYDYLNQYYWKDLGLFDWKIRIESRKNGVPRAQAMLETIEYVAGIKLKGKAMLDIGCGLGEAVVAGMEMGSEAYGCDADPKAIEIAKLRTKIHNVQSNYAVGIAEHLPFKDNVFDYVQCVSVLEHVDCVDLCIKEMLRVLKPDGIAFIQAPNYNWPFEEHYKILYPPKCVKWLAEIYLALLGRPSEFIYNINYVTYKGIRKELEQRGAKVIDIEKQFREKFHYNSTQNGQKFPWTYKAVTTKFMWQLMKIVKKTIKVFGCSSGAYFLIRKCSENEKI